MYILNRFLKIVWLHIATCLKQTRFYIVYRHINTFFGNEIDTFFRLQLMFYSILQLYNYIVSQKYNYFFQK